MYVYLIFLTAGPRTTYNNRTTFILTPAPHKRTTSTPTAGDWLEKTTGQTPKIIAQSTLAASIKALTLHLTTHRPAATGMGCIALPCRPMRYARYANHGNIPAFLPCVCSFPITYVATILHQSHPPTVRKGCIQNIWNESLFKRSVGFARRLVLESQTTNTKFVVVKCMPSMPCLGHPEHPCLARMPAERHDIVATQYDTTTCNCRSRTSRLRTSGWLSRCQRFDSSAARLLAAQSQAPCCVASPHRRLDNCSSLSASVALSVADLSYLMRKRCSTQIAFLRRPLHLLCAAV